MTRTQARRRRKRRRMIRKIGAWIALFLFEIFVAAVPTAMLAAILLSLALMERGYITMGSGWLAIPAAFCITYSIFHLWICKKIFEEV